MPISKYYKASSAAEIESCFYNISTGEERQAAQLLNAIMAQPLSSGIPPFCLMLFGADKHYNADDIAKRWSFVVKELKKRNITVLVIASDSDPKYNAAMKCAIKLGNLETPQWFNAEILKEIEYIPVQDTVHIGTKFRNCLLNNKSLRFGRSVVSVCHLKKLIDLFSKDKHDLCETVIDTNDRQNFESVLKITSAKVIDLLRSKVNDSQGTVLYLTVIDKILRSFLDRSLNPLQRIKYIWFATFILRIWKSHIKQSKTQRMATHFISSNCYSCVEINAHALVILMLNLREKKLDHLFKPDLFGSQQCEHTFRQIRSLSSTYSTVTNASMLEILHKMSRVDLMNRISYIDLKHYNFPRVNQQSSSYYPYESNLSNVQLPDRNEIFQEIEMAKLEAVQCASDHGISVKCVNDLFCDINTPNLSSADLQANEPESEIIDYEAQSIENDSEILRLFENLKLNEYSDKIEPSQVDANSLYAVVRDSNGKRLCIKKHSLCWLMDKTTTKLSSDRLIRVMGGRRK